MKSEIKTGLLATVVTAMLLLHLLLAWNSRQLLRKGYADFTIFYAAGKIVRSGQRTQLYDPALQFQVERSFAGEVSTRQATLPFNHPGFEALLFVPFTLLPYYPAYLLWTAINLGLLFSVPLILRDEIGVLREFPPAVWGLLSLAFFPAFIALLQGQDSILFLALVSSAFVRFKRGRDLAAGCFLGLGSFRYHLLLILLLVLVLLQLWKVLSGVLGTVIGMAAVSLATVGWQGALAYPRFVWNQERTLSRGSSIVYAMPNVRGLLALFGGGAEWTAIVSAVVACLGVLVIVLAVRNTERGRTQLSCAVFSLSLVLSMVVSYHVLVHDLTVLLLPVYLTLERLRRDSSTRGCGQALLLWPMLGLLFSPLPILLWLRYQATGVMAVLLLLWFAAMAADRRESGGCSMAVDSSA